MIPRDYVSDTSSIPIPRYEFLGGCEKIQRRQDDNKTKICSFEGGDWGHRGKLSKALFFVGNATTIKD